MFFIIFTISFSVRYKYFSLLRLDSWTYFDGILVEIIQRKDGFAKVFRNLVRYRSENNFIGLLK